MKYKPGKTTTCIVRDRGQLTIPDSIRQKAPWIASASVVNIAFPQPDLILITPHIPQINWYTLWNSIRLARSFKGKIKNVSQLIAQDREER